jgi:hypothetical protein
VIRGLRGIENRANLPIPGGAPMPGGVPLWPGKEPNPGGRPYGGAATLMVSTLELHNHHATGVCLLTSVIVRHCALETESRRDIGREALILRNGVSIWCPK